MRSRPFTYGSSLLLAWAILTIPGCATTPPRSFDGPRVAREVPPIPAVRRAVEDYKRQDRDASFTFVNGQVDSFATTAKAHVPDYAVPILVALGLPTTNSPIVKLAAPVRGPVQAVDLDSSPEALPFVNETMGPASPGRVGSDAHDRTQTGLKPPTAEVRRLPARLPERMIEWSRPDQSRLALEARAAGPIVTAFLQRNANLFNADLRELERGLGTMDYRHSAYVRRLAFDQYVDGTKLLYGRTIVQFDANWNVIGISRMLVTPEKIGQEGGVLAAAARGGIVQEAAIRAATAAPPSDACKSRDVQTLRVDHALDMIRKRHVWDVELAGNGGECHWRTIVGAATGQVLNVSDLVDYAHTDASVNRWLFPGGDLSAPKQVVSTGQYTRNDRRLEHDFFYMMNDHRCDGAAETSCPAVRFTTTQCERAYGSTSGRSTIRATRRSDRDFRNYFPGGASETFAETNAYYWARQFSQWLKPSLDALGVLPDSARNYPRVLIITNACQSGSSHIASLSVTTEDDKGEGTNVIRLAHRNPSEGATSNAACEGGGCFDNPSNLHHELNHFFLRRYYDFGSDLDCDAGNQMRFTHEGTLGTVVPHAFWHRYYGVGYNPSDTRRLYFSDSDIGRVHSNESTRMTVGNHLCRNLTGDPYVAGRVVGQALWKFYHGVSVNGSKLTPISRPKTDTDFNTLVYWAAELQAASTYKDRYEYANRVMELLDKHSNWSSQGKRDYCNIFQRHGLRNFIADDYCS